MQFSYDPPEGSPPSTDTLGHHFDKGKPVDVTDESVIRVLKGNRFFKAKGASRPAAETEAGEYVAKDVGHGWYAIFEGGKRLDEKSMRKDDAEAFNAMSAADKAEYVANN